MGITMEKQRAILESVIKEEIDFISYVDLEDGMVHTIVTNEDADVMPPIDGDYQKVNDVTIPKYVHPEDREMCEREFRLERLQENLQKKNVSSLITVCCAAGIPSEINEYPLL